MKSKYIPYVIIGLALLILGIAWYSAGMPYPGLMEDSNGLFAVIYAHRPSEFVMVGMELTDPPTVFMDFNWDEPRYLWEKTIIWYHYLGK